ncbi:hypothetical protein TNCV_168061 [Trichonephila clavipes]|nr:hypothetical protein TNCV_168061 [Trichonephila clavipes]
MPKVYKWCLSVCKKSEESEAFRIDETEDEFRMDLDNIPGENTSEFRSNSEPNSTSLVDAPLQAHQVQE